MTETDETAPVIILGKTQVNTNGAKAVEGIPHRDHLEALDGRRPMPPGGIRTQHGRVRRAKKGSADSAANAPTENGAMYTVATAIEQTLARNAGGRNFDPQGGRRTNANTKVNIYEVEALYAEKARIEQVIGRRMTDSEFLRHRLLAGGPTLIVQYPVMPK